MPFVAWFTVVVAVLIIAATALGLFRVLMHLRAVDSTLEQVTGGVQAVAAKTSTVPTALPSVNASLAPVRDFADSI
jgi:Tfp pilus assembly protein PilV